MVQQCLIILPHCLWFQSGVSHGMPFWDLLEDMCEKICVPHLNTVRMWNTTVGLTQVAPISTSLPAHQRTSETADQGISLVTCLWHPLAFFTLLYQAEEERRAAAGEELHNVFLPLTSCPHAFMLSCLQACLCILRLLSIYPYIYICICIYVYIYINIYIYVYYYRRKFRSETSDNMDSWKAEVRRVRREKIRRKKMQMREKVGKSRFTVFFQWFVAPEGRKVGSLKRRVRTQLARWEMKKCTPLWREAHFQVKMYKTHQCRTTFGSWDVEKVPAVVARSTFSSQNVQNTPFSDHFLKLRCRKSARSCGAKHISKSKCTKHTSFGPLLEVEMSKKCTPLWREAHFEVKSVKNWRSRTTFWSSDVEKVSKKCTPLWREAHFEVKSVKNWGFWAFFDVKMSKK